MTDPGTDTMIGKKAPRLKLALSSEETVKFIDYSGQWIVLYFYPKDSTPGCTTEGNDFNAMLPKFKRAGATVLGVSRDSIKSHQNFCTKQGFNFDLVSDPDEALCKAFDVIHEKNMYGRKVMGVVRSTFLIDPEGVIRASWRKVKVDDHAQAVLDTLKALQKQVASSQ